MADRLYITFPLPKDRYTRCYGETLPAPHDDDVTTIIHHAAP
ncbi:MAG TPA: hypothetical protein VLU73_17935 [Methylococcaceae bacterium]|jgi:hypothetical protein|nr:hypothetical protein [Methylococcaceae bacterium]